MREVGRYCCHSRLLWRGGFGGRRGLVKGHDARPEIRRWGAREPRPDQIVEVGDRHSIERPQRPELNCHGPVGGEPPVPLRPARDHERRDTAPTDGDPKNSKSRCPTSRSGSDL